jgi:hypothetical protein
LVPENNMSAADFQKYRAQKFSSVASLEKKDVCLPQIGLLFDSFLLVNISVP